MDCAKCAIGYLEVKYRTLKVHKKEFFSKSEQNFFSFLCTFKGIQDIFDLVKKVSQLLS
jgi:hypothetical protein